MERLEHFVMAHLGAPVEEVRKEFAARFSGETIGGGLAAESFVYDPVTREVTFAVATIGIPDGIGQVNVRSGPIEEA